MWENVLLCQFHDCLPGSSIEMCYDDSDKVYAEVFSTGTKARTDALSVLGMTETLDHDSHLIAMNTLPWTRTELVEVPSVKATSQQSKYAVVSGGPGGLELQNPSVLGDASASIKEVKDGVFQMTNAHFSIEVESGCITSLMDLKANREVIAKDEKANQLVIFDDKPLYWQAWDVEVYHLNSRHVLQSGKSRILENGPHKVSVVTETQISKDSWVKTTISLATSMGEEPGYVAIDCEVEWRETMKFLKVEFPVDIVNTEASYETQYGITRRPTHYNTR
jgi:alpha-mannosidase